MSFGAGFGMNPFCIAQHAPPAATAAKASEPTIAPTISRVDGSSSRVWGCALAGDVVVAVVGSAAWVAGTVSAPAVTAMAAVVATKVFLIKQVLHS